MIPHLWKVPFTRPGKHTKNYWKLPFIVDLPIKNGDLFSIAMFVYQRVFKMFRLNHLILIFVIISGSVGTLIGVGVASKALPPVEPKGPYHLTSALLVEWLSAEKDGKVGESSHLLIVFFIICFSLKILKGLLSVWYGLDMSWWGSQTEDGGDN